jgi:hypothetical protein
VENLKVGQQKFTKGVSYPGLFFTASQIGAHFPKCRIYCEPFSGLARTAKYARCEIMVLNDMGKYANEYCKKKFSKAIITHEDFMACIKRWDSKDTFFLIDPPWDNSFYDSSGKMEGETTLNQFARSNRKKAWDVKKGVRNKKWNSEQRKKHGDGLLTSAFIDRKVSQYIKDLESLLPTLQGKFIVTLANDQNIKSLYSKLITYPGKVIFNFNPKTMMFSNQPLKIQIPQITEFIEC